MHISGSTPVPRPDRRCLGRYTSIRSLSIFMDPMRGTTVRSPRVSCSDLPSGWVGGVLHAEGVGRGCCCGGGRCEGSHRPRESVYCSTV